MQRGKQLTEKPFVSEKKGKKMWVSEWKKIEKIEKTQIFLGSKKKKFF